MFSFSLYITTPIIDKVDQRQMFGDCEIILPLKMWCWGWFIHLYYYYYARWEVRQCAVFRCWHQQLHCLSGSNIDFEWLFSRTDTAGLRQAGFSTARSNQHLLTRRERERLGQLSVFVILKVVWPDSYTEEREYFWIFLDFCQNRNRLNWQSRANYTPIEGRLPGWTTFIVTRRAGTSPSLEYF